MPAQYLLRVNSQPTDKVGEELWEKWYTEEHIPHLMDAGVSKRAALYRATQDLGGLQTQTKNEEWERMTFLAMYQTDYAAYQEADNYHTIPSTSPMLPGEEIGPSAEWDVRNYDLIQNFDPDNVGEVPAPYILNVIMAPNDEDDYNDWYKNEHLGMLHKVPGYRRSQRYKLGKPDFVGRTPKDCPKYLALHEWDHLQALDGPELREADASPNTIRILKNSRILDVRGFKLVKYFPSK